MLRYARNRLLFRLFLYPVWFHVVQYVRKQQLKKKHVFFLCVFEPIEMFKRQSSRYSIARVAVAVPVLLPLPVTLTLTVSVFFNVSISEYIYDECISLMSVASFIFQFAYKISSNPYNLCSFPYDFKRVHIQYSREPIIYRTPRRHQSFQESKRRNTFRYTTIWTIHQLLTDTK